MSLPMTTKYQLVEVRLGSDLSEYLRKASEAGRSLRQIAADLSERSTVDISYETIRTWLGERAAS